MDVTIRSCTSGKVCNRSAAHLKVLPRNTEAAEPGIEIGDNHTEEPQTSKMKTVLDERRPNDENNEEIGSKRKRVESKRLKDYVTY